MYIDYSPEQSKLRSDLRAYFDRLITDEVRAEYSGKSDGGGPLFCKVLQQMGADGWLGIGWPKEFGGLDRSPIDQYIFFDEVQRAGFPIPFLTLCTVGPTLMKFGTEAQKTAILPKILKGECHFAIGYSEPEAGTDLASLKTRAVRDGDHYVVTGQKVFTSLAEYADYIWLAVRTDADAPKHKGISILMVDTKLPGFSLSPIHTLGDNRTNATYYDNVRVPASMLVGRENEGWRLITNQLNHERVALSLPGVAARFVDETTTWARETRRPDGSRVIDDGWVQQNLARARGMVDVLELMCWRQAWNIQRNLLDPAESSAVKVFGSESFVRVYQLLHEVLGQPGCLKEGSPGALLEGRLERFYRTTLVLTFGGGVNEVQRDIIAMVGLGMPRPPRLCGRSTWIFLSTRSRRRSLSCRGRSSPSG
jgi:3-oxocholest-4-en-26-oyl-CoA dehydrogenase alpha subunit